MTAVSLGISWGFLEACTHSTSRAYTLCLQWNNSAVLHKYSTYLSQCVWRDSPNDQKWEWSNNKKKSVHAGHREKLSKKRGDNTEHTLTTLWRMSRFCSWLTDWLTSISFRAALGNVEMYVSASAMCCWRMSKLYEMVKERTVVRSVSARAELMSPWIYLVEDDTHQVECFIPEDMGCSEIAECVWFWHGLFPCW